MPRQPASVPKRIGLREVARAAKVCLMTASLSLRDHPKISEPTRRRVRRCAEQLGYRPDPEIARLMGRLRSSRMKRGSVMVALVDASPTVSEPPHPYNAAICHGITARADALGIGVSLFRLADYDGLLPQLVRVIRHRGIRGIILLPSTVTVALDPSVRWDGLSVVAATTSVVSPRFHQVVPNQLYNMMQLIEHLHRRGFRKIGAILKQSLEVRTHHYYSVALTWHGHRDRILLLPDDASKAETDRLIGGWLVRHGPDAIIAQQADYVAEFLHSRGPMHVDGDVGLVSLSSRADRRIPYQDQLPELIGASAASLLAGMMHTNETGIPAHPQITTIDGVIRESGGGQRPVRRGAGAGGRGHDASRSRASR